MSSWIPRATPTIYNAMINEKNTNTSLSALQPNIDSAQTLLKDLNSTSKVSFWRTLFWNISYAIYLLEQRMWLHQVDVQNSIDKSYVGTPQWYAYKATQFQYGDVLVIDPVTYAINYPVINTANQLVGSSSVEQLNSQCIIKIRGSQTDILTDDQLASFTSYINQIKFVGTRLVIRNVQADSLAIYLNIVYNGQQDLPTVQAGVESTIIDYITHINFDSIMYVNELINKLQALPYVIDPQIDLTSSKVSAIGSAYSPLDWEYSAYSGYLRIDPNYPLSDAITYQSR